MNDLESKRTEALVDVGKDVTSDLVRPTSKSVGDNIGLLVDGVMGWLGYWGEKQKIKRAVCLEDYKKKITEKVLGIPEQNLIEPPIRLVGPAIEASKFFIEEEYCRDMFAKLIASACDSSKVNSVHPAFPEIIKQLTPLDARFFQLFKERNTYPAAELTAVHPDEKVSPFPNMLFDFRDSSASFNVGEQLELTKTIESLIRFGLLIKNTAVLELNYNYDSFKNHWFYKGITPTLDDGSKLRITKYRVELTLLGQDFLKTCLPEQE